MRMYICSTLNVAQIYKLPDHFDKNKWTFFDYRRVPYVLTHVKKVWGKEGGIQLIPT